MSGRLSLERSPRCLFGAARGRHLGWPFGSARRYLMRDDSRVDQNIPPPLLTLAGEAFDAVISRVDPAQFGGTAVYDQQKDSIFKAPPSFARAAEAIGRTPLVAVRYGEDYVADRLALQFIYQLFPRAGAVGIANDARRLWRRFVSELKRAEWIFSRCCKSQDRLRRSASARGDQPCRGDQRPAQVQTCPAGTGLRRLHLRQA
jgi:hypothetical protein